MDTMDPGTGGDATNSFIYASSDSEYGTMGYSGTFNDGDGRDGTTDMIGLAREMDNYKENVRTHYESHVKSNAVGTPNRLPQTGSKVLHPIQPHNQSLQTSSIHPKVKKHDGNVSLLFSSHSTPLVSKQNNTIHNKWERSNGLPEINELENYGPITKIRQSMDSVHRQNTKLNQVKPVNNDSLYYSDSEDDDGDDEEESEEDSGLDIKNRHNTNHINKNKHSNLSDNKSHKQIPSIDKNGSFQDSGERDIQRPKVNEETPRTTPPHSQEEINNSKSFIDNKDYVNMNDEVYKIIVTLKKQLEQERLATKLLREEVDQLKKDSQPHPTSSASSEPIEDIGVPYPIELNLDDSTVQFQFEDESTRHPSQDENRNEKEALLQLRSDNGKLRLDNNNLSKRLASLENQCHELNNEVKYLRHVKDSTEQTDANKQTEDFTEDICLPIKRCEIGVQVNKPPETDQEQENEKESELQSEEANSTTSNKQEKAKFGQESLEGHKLDDQPINMVNNFVNGLETRAFKLEIERLNKRVELLTEQYEASQVQLQGLQQEIGTKSELLTLSNCQDSFFRRHNLEKVDILTKVEMSNIIKQIMMKLSIGKDLEANIRCLGLFVRMSMHFIDELHEILYVNNEFKPSDYLTNDSVDSSMDRLNDCMNDMIKNIDKLLQ